MLPAVTPTHQPHRHHPKRFGPLARMLAGIGVGTLVCALPTVTASAAPTLAASASFATDSADSGSDAADSTATDSTATDSTAAEPADGTADSSASDSASSGVSPSDASAAPASTGVDASDGPAPLVGMSSDDVIADQYIVVLKEQSTASAGGKPAPSAAKLVGDAVARGKKLGAEVDDQYSHALEGYSATMSPSELAKVRDDPAVDYVQANQKYTSTTAEGSPTWGLDRVDQRNLPLKKQYYYTNTGKGVTAYVVDTGIRSTHLDFTTNVAGDAVDSRVSGGISEVAGEASTEDCDGHGTHVAGTVGGTYYGVAKEVHLVPVRVLNCKGESDSSTVAKGLDWIVGNHTTGPAVVNMSLTNDGGPDKVVENAVNRVIKDKVTVVIAAGNGNSKGVGVSACSVSPSNVKAAIVVGATTRSDRRATFSNFGSCVDVYAPGAEIESDWYTGDDVAAQLSGTSMATPHVTGAVALYLQKHPTASPAAVQKAIIAASTPNKVTNVSKAWPRRLLFAVQPVKPPAATTTPGQITSGTALLSGKKICSPNAAYCLTVRATDGKLVLKKGTRVIWASTKGGAAWTKLNTNGDLVSYNAYNQAAWSTKTGGTGPSTLFVRNTGKLALVSTASGKQTWTAP